MLFYDRSHCGYKPHESVRTSFRSRLRVHDRTTARPHDRTTARPHDRTTARRPRNIAAFRAFARPFLLKMANRNGKRKRETKTRLRFVLLCVLPLRRCLWKWRWFCRWHASRGQDRRRRPIVLAVRPRRALLSCSGSKSKRPGFPSGLASGRLRSPPVASGRLRSPPVASGRLRSPPVASGRLRSPPVAPGRLRSPPVAPGHLQSTSLAKHKRDGPGVGSGGAWGGLSGPWGIVLVHKRVLGIKSAKPGGGVTSARAATPPASRKKLKSSSNVGVGRWVPSCWKSYVFEGRARVFEMAPRMASSASPLFATVVAQRRQFASPPPAAAA